MPAYIVLSLLQFWIGTALPLVPDESYYLAWSKRLALGYFDHPPMVAWLLSLLELPPRVLAFGLCHISLWILADAGRVMGLRNWRWIPLVLLMTPLGMAWGVIWTPDAPLVLSWCILLWCVCRRYILGVGLALAFGLWSKAAIIPAIPGIIWALGLRRGAGAILLAVVLYTPHLFWSASHDWLPWSYQAGRHQFGFWGPENLAVQMLLAGPLVGWIGVRRLWRRETELSAVLFRLTLPLIIFWGVIGLCVRIEGNWPILIWPGLALLVVDDVAHLMKTMSATYGGVVLICAVALAGSDAMQQKVPDLKRVHQLEECVHHGGLSRTLKVLRYQEKAVLDEFGVDLEYVRPHVRRASQYDLWETPRRPACGDLILGPADVEWPACRSQERVDLTCGVTAYRCGCPQKKTSEPGL